MDCLKDYIGLKGCGIAEPLSKRFVNSLPGISLKGIDNAANSEQITYAKVWEDIQERAAASFSTKVTAKFAERFRLKKVLETIDLGEKASETANQTIAAAEYRGFTYQLRFADSHYKPSALQQIFVQRVKVYLKAAGNVTIRIFDLDKKKVLKTLTITGGVLGWNYVNVNECYSAFHLFFAYDATAIGSAFQEITGYAHACCSSCAEDIYDGDCEGRLRGAKATIADPYTITEGNNTYGLSAEISLHCSFDNVVCNNKKVFETAWWYHLGEEVMVTKLTSPRFNLTTIDTKEAEQLQGYFMSKTADELANAVDGIDLDTSDCCLECNAAVTYAESKM